METAEPARRLPPALLEHARNGGPVVAPRDAATVVLLRDAEGHGIEAYLLRRLSSMAFAGGMYVFPGGSVDPRDADWAGELPESWAPALDASEGLARSLVCAAVRETFEESGVLLADGSMADPAAEQKALLDRTASMTEVLRRNDLTLRADLLRPWSHWLTPEFEPKRFDTRFFVAALPAGAEPVHYEGEADRAAWVRPADAVASHAAGEMGMLPPTVFTLAELAEYESVADVLAAHREIRRVLPKVVVSGDDVRLLLPGEPGYPE